MTKKILLLLRSEKHHGQTGEVLKGLQKFRYIKLCKWFRLVIVVLLASKVVKLRRFENGPNPALVAAVIFKEYLTNSSRVLKVYCVPVTVMITPLTLKSSSVSTIL